MDKKKKRVVIVGMGYGGIKLARKLKNSDFQVFLVDKTNYHQFQPLFYQVATAGLEAISISFPVRKMFQKYKDYHFRLAELKEVLTETNEIKTSIGNISYDYLVIATGTGNNFYGNKNIEKYSFPLKSVTESLDLRNKILQNNENAICVKDAELRKGILSLAIVGGGPTGIELAGSISEMRKYVLPKDYPELNYKEMEIYLFDSTARLVKGMSEASSVRAEKYMNRLGVKVFFNSRVKDYDGKTLFLEDGRQFKAHTLIWAAGVTGQMIKGLNDKIYWRGNRIKVDRCNRVPGYENIFALGDIAYMCEEKYPEGHLQLAEVAIQQAKLLAKNIKLFSEGKQMKEFKYKNVGVMATIGRNLAVADLPNYKLGGTLAWFYFMFYHLMSILVVKNKLSIFIHWAFKYFTYDKSLRLIIERRDKTKEFNPTE